MVRLKQLMEVFYEQISMVSQFHYGSIKTNTFYNQIYKNNGGLNSTMVRLKPKQKQF